MYDSKSLNLSPSLVSNFIQALSLFAQDLFTSDGSLKTIQHDTAVILLHQISDLTFVLIAPTETIQLRLALREFAKITSIIFEKVPESRLLAQEDTEIFPFVRTYFRV